MMPDPNQASGGLSAQVLLKLGEISAQIAVITKTLESVPDHESRLRALERFRFTIVGAATAISAVFSGLGTWIGLIITRH